MNILLIGSTGLLGTEFARILEKTNHTVLAPTKKTLDITNPIQIERYFDKHSIELILHCAGYTNVEQAETDQDLCFQINTESLEHLLQQNTPIIHFSTDYVFNEDKIRFPKGIPENTTQGPINVYGQSKQIAEKILENWNGKWWNIRTSWLYGKGGPNFVDIMTTKLTNEEEITVIEDQHGRLTNAQDLAHFVLTQFIDQSPPNGHYHLQNSGETSSWADITEHVQQILKTSCKIQRIPSNEYPTKAKRPAWSVLQNTKLPAMPEWSESLRKYLENR